LSTDLMEPTSSAIYFGDRHWRTTGRAHMADPSSSFKDEGSGNEEVEE
jgi:hypothetical protein